MTFDKYFKLLAAIGGTAVTVFIVTVLVIVAASIWDSMHDKV